jgi:hypothetical protein
MGKIQSEYSRYRARQGGGYAPWREATFEAGQEMALLAAKKM